MLKEIYFGVQGALLILAGCAASDMWYRGILPGIYAAVIIIACVMSVYSSFVLYLRIGKKKNGNSIKFSVFNTTGHTPAILETTELTHDELKPCPFCGGDAEVIGREAHNVFVGLAVWCKRCLCGTTGEYAGRIKTLTDYLKTDTSLADVLKSVVDKWNNRAAENVQSKSEGGITNDNGRKKNVRKNNS